MRKADREARNRARIAAGARVRQGWCKICGAEIRIIGQGPMPTVCRRIHDRPAQRAPCIECGGVVEKPRSGRTPLRCAQCRAEHLRQREAAKRDRQRTRTPKRMHATRAQRAGPCVDCGGEVRLQPKGPLPKRCPGCRKAHKARYHQDYEAKRRAEHRATRDAARPDVGAEVAKRQETNTGAAPVGPTEAEARPRREPTRAASTDAGAKTQGARKQGQAATEAKATAPQARRAEATARARPKAPKPKQGKPQLPAPAAEQQAHAQRDREIEARRRADRKVAVRRAIEEHMERRQAQAERWYDAA